MINWCHEFEAVIRDYLRGPRGEKDWGQGESTLYLLLSMHFAASRENIARKDLFELLWMQEL